MGGILGIGGSSAKTDRSTQLSGQSGLWNIFSQGLGMAGPQAAAGTSDTSAARGNLGTAEQYFKGLMTAGRTETAQNAAPAINATMAQSDAARSAAGNFGTGRTGGTAAVNREAGTTTASTIDNIINQNQIQGKQQGAQGLEYIAEMRAAMGEWATRNALASLGLSSQAVDEIMQNATQSRPTSQAINQQTQQQWGQAIGDLVTQFL